MRSIRIRSRSEILYDLFTTAELINKMVDRNLNFMPRGANEKIFKLSKDL